MTDKSQQFAAMLDDQIQSEAHAQARVDVYGLYEALVQNLEELGVSPLAVDVPRIIARIKNARARVIASKRVAQLAATESAPVVAASGVQLGEATSVQDAALGEYTKAKVSGFIGGLVDVRDGGTPLPGEIVGGVLGEGVRPINPREDGPEMVDLTPPARRSTWPIPDDAELAATIRALTDEVHALREAMRGAGARSSVIAFSTPT